MLINRKKIAVMINCFRVNEYEKNVANFAFNLSISCYLPLVDKVNKRGRKQNQQQMDRQIRKAETMSKTNKLKMISLQMKRPMRRTRQCIHNYRTKLQQTKLLSL